MSDTSTGLPALDGQTVFVAALVCVLLGLLTLAAYLRTRRRRGRAATQDKLRDAIEAMPEGLAFYDAEDRIVVWNRRYAELNDEGGGLLVPGASFRALLEAGLRNGVYPEAAGREDEWLEARLARRQAGEVVIEQENKSRWLRIVERRSGDGGMVSVCEDITEMKAREASLRLMFEHNPAPMWISDRRSGRMIDVNEAAVAQYGYSREQFLTMRLTDLYAPEEHEALRKPVSLDGETLSPGLNVWRQLRADGSELFARPLVQAIRYEGRDGVIAAQIDVTASKKAEEALEQARDQAEAANRARGEFLANMSHEIRTPLNGVTGVVQVLARSRLDPQQAEMVRVIESSAVTLERLLSDILDLARVDSGHVEVHPEPFDLGEAVRSAAALSEMRAREKGIAFELTIDPAAEGAAVGDAGRIKQILLNLLSNAVKFTPAGRVSMAVGVDRTAEPPVFSFAVTDTGVGFEPGCAERLFKRFEQADGSITRQFGGAGLGLAISRRLAELMGGELLAASEPGRGAVFTLRLPLRRAAGLRLEPAWEAAPAFVGGSEPRALRVLLAEDHPTNRKVVQLMLSTMGADLTCVENGEEAVRAARAGRFDVVLMDMRMPVMDGLTAIRLIRDDERATGAAPLPLFTLSANAMSEHVEASLAAGADRHLTKPITATVLLRALAEITEQVALREAA